MAREGEGLGAAFACWFGIAAGVSIVLFTISPFELEDRWVLEFMVAICAALAAIAFWFAYALSPRNPVPLAPVGGRLLVATGLLVVVLAEFSAGTDRSDPFTSYVLWLHRVFGILCLAAWALRLRPARIALAFTRGLMCHLLILFPIGTLAAVLYLVRIRLQDRPGATPQAPPGP
ncbi:MAG: hypothetical protein AAGD14_08185 [Planctomycetota bacterium]